MKFWSEPDYPFDHAQEGISLGEYLIATAPHQGDLGGILSSLATIIRPTACVLGKIDRRIGDHGRGSGTRDWPRKIDGTSRGKRSVVAGNRASQQR